MLPKLKPTQGGRHGAAILGAHLEGPFINKLKKGAHVENSITDLKEVLFQIKDS